MLSSVPAAVPVPARYVTRGRVRGWLDGRIQLADLFPPDGDPDRLLTRLDCRVVKLQRKVVVGRAPTPAGVLYVKRYNVFAWRIALGSLGRPSPAFRAWDAARTLTALGFETPMPVAAVEVRTMGLLRRSFFVTHEVSGAVTTDRRWRDILADRVAPRRRVARRSFARALGELVRRLHAAGVYHGDLKDVNILTPSHGSVESPRWVLLDLERVDCAPAVSQRRRVKNLVQLERTIGRLASATDRLRVLRGYLGADATRAERRTWVQQVLSAAAARDRRSPAPIADTRQTVSCTIVCQDEEAHIGECLESVAWCDEVVVVDGGSRDRTPAIARGYTDRVIQHRWPGYRAQKQFALDNATSEWVLNVDADERVSTELADEIVEALAHVPDDVDGFAIPRLVPYLGRWWYRGGWYPRPVVRLVRRTRTRWGGTDPHDRAIVNGRVIALEHPILHYTYDDVADHLRTVAKLTAVAAAEVAPGTRIGAGRLVIEPMWRFARSYFIKRAWLEGAPGFFVAATDAFYTFLRWARVRERASGHRRAP